MTNDVSPGFLHRIWTTLGGALKDGILGKSSHAYMKQFTGGDEYWDRAIAARVGWSLKELPKPDLDRFRSSGDVMVRARPSVRDNAPCAPELEYEPVHGWTKHQLEDYLARNPCYRSTYEAALQRCRCAADVGVNGPPIGWFGLRRINYDKATCNTEPNGAKQTRESQTDPLCGL